MDIPNFCAISFLVSPHRRHSSSSRLATLAIISILVVSVHEINWMDMPRISQENFDKQQAYVILIWHILFKQYLSYVPKVSKGKNLKTLKNIEKS